MSSAEDLKNSQNLQMCPLSGKNSDNSNEKKDHEIDDKNVQEDCGTQMDQGEKNGEFKTPNLLNDVSDENSAKILTKDSTENSENGAKNEAMNEMDTSMNCSVEIIEKTIPIVEVSDDEEPGVVCVENNEKEDNDLEKGDLPPFLQVIDESGPSSTPKRHTEEEEENNSDPILSIAFKNEQIKNIYGASLMKHLQRYPELKITTADLCLVVEQKSLNIPITKKKKNKSKKKSKRELFVVDTNPCEVGGIPDVKYQKKFSIEEGKNETEQQTKRQSQTCFNCSEDHALKDCKAPKNFSKINAAKQKFTSSRVKLTRYHEDEDQKYAHLKPGTISENLRCALGLRKHEIPSYIYGMREMGYPPGWLEEAKIQNSSLTIFNIHGEKVSRNKKKKTGLDPEKIVEYPGYNVPLSKGFHDDYRKYNVRPYSRSLEKENMIKHFENIVNVESDSDSADMDLDESIERSKKSIPDNVPTSAVSLIDLEKQKSELLDQLNSTSSNEEQQQQESSTPHKNGEVNKPEATNKVSVKNTTFGTPILKSSSPYSRLPNPDNFMVGVSPIIDFENLPNSTGKYEQMSGVLNKVRTTLKNKET